MSFPFMQPQIYERKSVNSVPYRDVAWDYTNNKPIFKNGNPVIVEGIEAVKSWAYRALLTRRYLHPQNSHEYGNDIYMLIGQPWLPETKLAEAERYVKECLMCNPYITGISNFKAEFKGSTVYIKFRLNTVYGTSEVNLNV